MEGVWIGCYLSKSKTPVYFIEEYEQDFDNLIIRGRSYFDNGSYKGAWTSEKVSIDIEKGKISYNYRTDFINNTYINQGQAEFNFIRKDANKSPYKLVGFSCDLYSNEKIKSSEIRVVDKSVNNDDKFLEDAKKFYEENKNFYITD